MLPKARDLQLEVLPTDPVARGHLLLPRSCYGPLISGLRRGTPSEADLHDGAAQELVRFLPCPRESYTANTKVLERQIFQVRAHLKVIWVLTRVSVMSRDLSEDRLSEFHY